MLCEAYVSVRGRGNAKQPKVMHTHPTNAAPTMQISQTSAHLHKPRPPVIPSYSLATSEGGIRWEENATKALTWHLGSRTEAIEDSREFHMCFFRDRDPGTAGNRKSAISNLGGRNSRRTSHCCSRLLAHPPKEVGAPQGGDSSHFVRFRLNFATE